MNKIKIYDLSLKISSSLPYYPGDPKIEVEPKLTIKENGVNILSINLGTHSGTHIDVPLHNINKGKSLDDISLDRFIGEAIFIYVQKKDNEPMDPDDIKEADIKKGDIVIIGTGWDRNKYRDNYFKGFPYFTKEMADFLISKEIKCIGADIPSVDGPGQGGVFHKKILSVGIGVVEALINLKPLAGKRMFFSALPLAIKKGDGSPVRAVAIEGLVDV